MLADTTTPDGYTVNSNGEWAVDGVVQKETVGAAGTTTDSSTAAVTTDTTTEAATDTTPDTTADPVASASQIPDVTGVYVGEYFNCTITYDGSQYWCAIDTFPATPMPAYQGNGVFGNANIVYTFSGNNLEINDISMGESIYDLVKR